MQLEEISMKAGFRFAALIALGIVASLTPVVACQTAPGPLDTTVEIPSGQEPNAAVSGTVAYRERIALTPGASLVVELRDVSLADAAAPLIARQTIANPGQVPINFKVEYSREDINSRQHLCHTSQNHRVRRPPGLHQRHGTSRDNPREYRPRRHAARARTAAARPG